MGWRKRLGLWGYQGLLGGAMLLVGPVLLMRRRQHYGQTIPSRLGLRPLQPRPSGREGDPLWIHAVSVGEVMVAATLAKAIPRQIPLLVTTVTPTGQAQARKIFGAPDAERPAIVDYLPFDLSPTVERFFRHYSPRGLILVEGDYWPQVLDAAHRRHLPVTVVNGRVGARAHRRQQKAPNALHALFFEPVARIAAQTERDRQRLVDSGAPAERIQVTGNLKFDSVPPKSQPTLQARLQSLAGPRPILVAGSTMAGEDEAVLQAFSALPPGRALLILAPRHPERAPDELQMTRQRGLRAELRSRLDGPRDDESLADEPLDVVVLDTLGELASLYALASIAFIGGTLVPSGGHNPLEPAHFAKAIVVGPSMENFKDMAEQFDDARAWRRAADADQLANVFSHWLDKPADAEAFGLRAAQLLDSNRGATQRTWDFIRPIFGL